ncbi:uncharacterized [Tachysurus ichikawai]
MKMGRGAGERRLKESLRNDVSLVSFSWPSRVAGASEREQGRANERGRWKVSENVQEFQEQVASGDMKGGRDKCNRRAL